MSVFSVITLFLILCIVSLTITANSIDILHEEFKCVPGEMFNYECNICSCGEDGKTPFCTYKLCQNQNEIIRPGHEQFRCVPGDLFRYDCYDCRCYDGINAFCNFALCNTKNSAQRFCEDGSSKKNECNNCKCINGEWACTKKYCVPEVDIFEHKECERGTTLRRGCNLCRCVPGVGYACDKTECPPDQPTDIIHDKSCNTDSIYNIGCNVCKCIRGLGYACDKTDCPEAVYVN